jgi:predicted Ser/Thr protein kinase
VEEELEIERYQRVKELFARARALPASEQGAFLAQACGADELLRAEVEELLAHAQSAGDFLTGPAQPPAVPSAEVRLTIPGFRLFELLAAGASGFVYRAEQERPRREVAIKVLRLDTLAHGQVARFQREAEILARLAHPGIAQVLEAGLAESPAGALPWIAMEFVRGRELSAWVTAERPDARALVRLFVALCDAVQHAHGRGIVHRDLKPSNVLVEPGGRPRVLDFGIAHEDERATAERTRTGLVMGTLAYMSPEQARGEPAAIGPASDVYALGAMLFEALTGALPIELEAADVLAGVRLVCESEPRRLRALVPGLSADLETILIKALEKDQLRRYASAGALGADLANWLADRPVLARRPTIAYQAKKFVLRNRALTAGAVVVITALATALAFSLRSLRVTRAERARTSAAVDALASRLFAFAPTLGLGEEQRTALEEVEATIAAQLELDPANRALKRSCARALNELAALDIARGESVRAFERANLGRALRAELVAADPGDVESWTQLSQLYARLGEARFALGDRSGRDEWFARALAVDERLVREHPGEPEFVEDLGWSLVRMIEGAIERGERDEAFALARRRLEQGKPLVAAEPDNWKYVYNLAHAETYVADGCRERGLLAEARAHSEEAVRLSQHLVELRPENRDFVAWRAYACRSAEVAAEADGDMEAASRFAQLALASAVTLAYSDPLRPENLEILLEMGTNAAEVERRLGVLEASRAALAHLRQVGELARRVGADARAVEFLSASADLAEARLATPEAAELERRGLATLVRYVLLPGRTPTQLGKVRGLLEAHFATKETEEAARQLLAFCEQLGEAGDLDALRELARLTFFPGREPLNARFEALVERYAAR